MTNEKRARELRALAVMAEQDAQWRAAGVINRAAEDVQGGNITSARYRIDALTQAAMNTSTYWDAYEHAKLAAEVLS